jgi:ribosomal-protein-alanine acetyltransferase
MMASAPPSLRYRPASSADLPALVQIERESFSDPWSEDAFSSALALDRMLVRVAEQGSDWDVRGPDDATGERDGGERIAGYVVALVAGSEADIADLAVAPWARRRGIGRALLDRMLEELASRSVRSVYLEVRESNRAARALYAARGFDAVGRRRGYYRRPTEDALLLMRRIGPT